MTEYAESRAADFFSDFESAPDTQEIDGHSFESRDDDDPLDTNDNTEDTSDNWLSDIEEEEEEE